MANHLSSPNCSDNSTKKMSPVDPVHNAKGKNLATISKTVGCFYWVLRAMLQTEKRQANLIPLPWSRAFDCLENYYGFIFEAVSEKFIF